MRLSILTAGVLACLWSATSFAQDRDDAAQQLKVQRLDAAEAAAQAVSAGRAALPAGCLVGALPTSAPSDAVVQAAIGQSWLTTGGWTQNYTVKYWRQTCATDTSKSAVLLRISFTGGKMFACSGSFKAIQGGRTFNSFRIKSSPTSVSSQCDYIYTDQTFVLDQWTINDNFDEQAAFTVVIDDYGYTISNASIPAFSGGGGASTPVTPSTGIVPATGWWWNASQAGRGWGIGMNGTDRVFLGGFVYSSAAGNPATWAVATLVRSSSGSNTFAGTLQYCSGGQALESSAPASATCAAGGDVTLTMSSSRAGRLSISRPFGLVAIDLVPYDQF
jgi:hypothetical protein